MESFKLLNTVDELRAAHALLLELDPTLEIENFLSTIARNSEKQILVFGLYTDNILRSTACVHVIEVIDGKRVLWIFDMVTESSSRSRGLGAKLVQSIEAYARENGYSELRVHSKNHRTRAHHFYRDVLGYSDWCVVFKKDV